MNDTSSPSSRSYAGSSSGSGAGNLSTRPTQALGNGIEELKNKVGDAVDRGKANLASSAASTGNDLAADVARLREDMAAIQKTLSTFATQSGREAAKTAQELGSAVASQAGAVAQQVGEAASEYASVATQQAKTFASEIENTARKNPLGTIGATLLVGIVIGMMSRGRA
jgi:ElaB/YqjD/DUF883 family membrane-anchored ribosome-binding protein